MNGTTLELVVTDKIKYPISCLNGLCNAVQMTQ